jgi:phosphatidylcholine synthase
MTELRQAATPTARQRFLGWCVHFYTATGLICAAGMAVQLTGDHPGPAQFHYVFMLMFLATVIDATDGTLARKVDIKRVVPEFDGRRLDDLTDFLTYTCLPLMLIWRAGLVPVGYEYWLVAVLLASAYGFCQSSIKTSDGYFRGFPSYWNLVAFYLYLLQLPAWLNLVVIIVLAILTFVPSLYFYPTQRGGWNRVMLILGSFWGILLIWILWDMSRLSPDSEASANPAIYQLSLASLIYPAFYLIVSWGISLRELLSQHSQA